MSAVELARAIENERLGFAVECRVFSRILRSIGSGDGNITRAGFDEGTAHLRVKIVFERELVEFYIAGIGHFYFKNGIQLATAKSFGIAEIFYQLLGGQNYRHVNGRLVIFGTFRGAKVGGGGVDALGVAAVVAQIGLLDARSCGFKASSLTRGLVVSRD